MRLNGTTRSPHRVPRLTPARWRLRQESGACREPVTPRSAEASATAELQADSAADLGVTASELRRSVPRRERELRAPAHFDVAAPGLGGVGPGRRERRLRGHRQELRRHRRAIANRRRSRLGAREAAASRRPCEAVAAVAASGEQRTGRARGPMAARVAARVAMLTAGWAAPPRGVGSGRRAAFSALADGSAAASMASLGGMTGSASRRQARPRVASGATRRSAAAAGGAVRRGSRELRQHAVVERRGDDVGILLPLRSPPRRRRPQQQHRQSWRPLPMNSHGHAEVPAGPLGGPRGDSGMSSLTSAGARPQLPPNRQSFTRSRRWPTRSPRRRAALLRRRRLRRKQLGQATGGPETPPGTPAARAANSPRAAS